MIVLNSPNNPTGSALRRGRRGAHSRRDRGAGACATRPTRTSAGPRRSHCCAVTSRVVVLRTFSKAMGMAGLRFGLALAHPAVAREIAKGKLPYNVNLITLAAAEVALDHAELLGARTREIAETRDRFLPRLAAIPGIAVFPTAANFVLIRCRARPGRGAVPPAARGTRHPGARRLRLRRAGGVPADLDRHGGGHGRGADGWGNRVGEIALGLTGAARVVTRVRTSARIGESAARPRRPISTSGSTWTAEARPRSRPASASSTTCWRRWLGTACSI